VVPRTNSSYYVQIEQPSPLQPLASKTWPFSFIDKKLLPSKERL
jgi:hypothetical protein